MNALAAEFERERSRASTDGAAHSKPLTGDQIKQVREVFKKGDVAATWELLASFGDKYAAAAAPGIRGSTTFFGHVIRNAWDVAGSDFSKFNDVARTHQNNYINLIEDNLKDKGKGTLPNSTAIEKSYYKALEKHGISPYTAVDLLISKIYSEGEVLPDKARAHLPDIGTNWHDKLFGTGVNLEPDRKGPPSEEAKSLSLRDATAQLATLTAVTADTQWRWQTAQARTAAPWIKYASDAVMAGEAKLRGASSITIETSGGFTLYNNPGTHTFAMFDKSSNGQAWIDGQWCPITDQTWRLDPANPDKSTYQYRDSIDSPRKAASLPGDVGARIKVAGGHDPNGKGPDDLARSSGGGDAGKPKASADSGTNLLGLGYVDKETIDRHESDVAELRLEASSGRQDKTPQRPENQTLTPSNGSGRGGRS